MFRLFLSAWLLLLCCVSFAKGYKGKVFEVADNGEKLPVPGVNVVVKGTQIGTVTGANGQFILDTDVKNVMLVFSYVGYHKVEVTPNDPNNITVQMVQGETLDGVTISKRRKSTSFSRVNPIQSQKVSGAELTKCACCNLSESFETNASVDVSFADAVSGAKTIKMLGLSGKYSQMMVENIPALRGAQNSYGLEYIPGTWMQSIQISKGTAAVKSGAESITGQINVELKEPDGEEKGSFYMYGNQDGKMEWNANYAMKLSEHWSTAFFAHYEDTYREMDNNKDGFLDRPVTRQSNFYNKWKYKSDFINWKVGLSYMEETRNGGQVNYDHLLEPDQQEVYGIGLESQKMNVYSKLGFIFDRKNTSLGLVAKYDYYTRDSFYGHQYYDIDQSNIYGSVVFQSYLFNENHNYTVGANYVNDQNKNQVQFSNDNSLQDVGFDEEVIGAYLEYTYAPTDDITFLAGARYDHSSLHGSYWTPRLHLRWAFNSSSTIRLSAGKGYRTPQAIAENSRYLASAKVWHFDQADPIQEEAWNFGASLINNWHLWDKPLTLSLDFYRTEFKNQMVVDLNQSPYDLYLYSLDGSSFSNSFQIEARYEPFERFELTTAFRVNDVEMTFKEVGLKEVPMMAKYKGLVSASYSTNMRKWQFDLTAQFNGAQQLPTSEGRDPVYQQPSESPAYTVLMAQVTKNYRAWSFYVGGENLTNYTQDNPIIAANDPFSSKDFDAAQVWGPIYGRMFYFGIKYAFDY
ncbi:TonB-dependent receptor [Halosquirtibacter laminarini]|uniref:TonB-dependent receptor n=1 Tax=Halosquirtibacter laminarini TaxID=3374600 RepID=A0AC61NFZ6_9BACT|nr:TonB-dependent receptor [Prolixibacteraceae bacterium]